MLKLDEEYYVRVDQTNFILMRKHKPTKAPIQGKQKETTETVIGFYASMPSLIKRYRTERMRGWIDSGKMDLDDLCERIVALDEILTKQMDKFNNLKFEPAPKRRKKNLDKCVDTQEEKT